MCPCCVPDPSLTFPSDLLNPLRSYSYYAHLTVGETEVQSLVQSFESTPLGGGRVRAHIQTLWAPESSLSWAILSYPYRTQRGC